MGARKSAVGNFLVSLACLLYLYGIVIAAPKVRVSVDLEKPRTVAVLAFITPDEANRFVVVAIGTESGSYGSSSARALNGLDERTEHQFVYRDIPRGEYLVVATVFDEDAKPIAQGIKRFYR